MSETVYVIKLGSGLYLDSDGALHHGAPPPVPSYTMPGGVFATLDEIGKMAKTFNDIGDALPNKGDGEKFTRFAQKLSDLGAPEELTQLLGAIGQIASVVGSVFVVVGVAVAAAKLLGMFNEGPSPLEVLVKARFDALDTQVRALQALSVQKDLDKQRNALVSARSTVESFVSQRDSGTMTIEQIATRLQTLITNFSLLSANQILNLLDTATYTVFFDADEYVNVWPWIATHLFRVPAGSPPQRATFPAVNAPVFDHRLAVPLASQAAQTFLGLVRSLSPEFRTTGDLRPTLRDFADKLSTLAETLRNTALARTIYFEGDFGWLIDDFYVIDSLPGVIDPVLKPEFFCVVGAMDLCSHNNAFFADVAKGGGVPWPGPSRRGNLDFRWHPPARLVRAQVGFTPAFHTDGSPIIQYRVTNAKECADAANEQSLQDYSDLLVSSGYMTLVQLTAQLRHAATQPDRSETVQGQVLSLRHAQPGHEVTVVSAPGPILFTKTGEIKAQAWLEPQQVQCTVSCTTQPVFRTPPLIHYRVLLRTLSSASPPRGWAEPNYDAIQSASYIDDPLHPGSLPRHGSAASFKRLDLETSFAAMLQEELLIEGPSQSDARHVERTITFKADTFDWWIPVSRHPGVSQGATALLQDAPVVFVNPAGKSTGGPRPLPRFFLPQRDALASDSATLVLGLGWEDGAQTWQGSHRETKKEVDVQLHVKLHWQGDRLHVTIDENRPEDRNYIVFLVVEETFGSIESDEHPPKVLHTAFPVPINGQLTYVPQDLFDQERAASDKQRAFAQEYAVSVEPKPGGPVQMGIHPGELTTEAGVARLAAALRQFHPEIFNQLTLSHH